MAVVVDSALRKLDLNYTFEIIANPNLFKEYKVNDLPALIIDGEILVEGYVPTLDEMMGIFE